MLTRPARGAIANTEQLSMEPVNKRDQIRLTDLASCAG
jgi:hypothetical protein